MEHRHLVVTSQFVEGEVEAFKWRMSSLMHTVGG